MNDSKEKMEKMLAEYLKTGERTGRTKQGLRDSKSRVPKFLNFLEGKNIELSAIDRNTALEYQAELLETRTKTGKLYDKHTVCGYVVEANGFCEFLADRGILQMNPFKKLKRIRPGKKLPDSIPDEKDTAALLERLHAFDTGKGLKEQVSRYRVHVIAELMYASGLRIEEVANLKKEDLDLQHGMVSVRCGKGGIARVAYLTSYACNVLGLYVEKMKAATDTEWQHRMGNSLFGTGYFNLGKVVNQTLAKAAEEAGVKKLTSHGFRHALGFHLLRAGCNIRHIQAILGHKRLRNTEIYTKVSREDLKEVMDKYHPRQWRRYWLD